MRIKVHHVSQSVAPRTLLRRAHACASASHSSIVCGLQFNFASLISYCSQYMTLDPQDLVVTGTPAGVGRLAPGDEVVVELNCGPRLVNTVGGQSRFRWQ